VERAAAFVLAAGLVALAFWAVSRVLSVLRDARQDAAQQRTLQLLAMFAPGIAAAADDPRALLCWQPLAKAARALFPSEFDALDRAAGATFPFSADEIDAAHARWTAAWLAWEVAHDAEYRLRGAALEEELGPGAGSGVGRARLEAVAREKIERYQQRYEDYTRVSRGLQRLGGGARKE